MKSFKTTLFTGLLAVFLVMGIASFAQAKAQLTFCETFQDDMKPEKEGDKFEGPNVSCVLKSDAAFGMPTITMTIYKKSGGTESIARRTNMDINPAWNVYGIRNISLDKEGNYTITFTTPAGETIASGDLVIEKMKAPETIKAAPEQTVGKTLEEIYKKYAPKQ